MTRLFSLKVKLFLSVIAVILFFVGISLVFILFFLKPFYLHGQKKMLIETSLKIRELYLSDKELLMSEFERIERRGGYRITITADEDTVIYDSVIKNYHPGGVPGFPRTPNHPPPVFPEDLLTCADGIDEYAFAIHADDFLRTNQLTMFSFISESETLQLSHPLESIDNGIAITIRFFVLIGSVALLVGSLSALFLAEKFTRPIKRLREIAVSMADLDFSQKYEVKTDDEIGELGKSINSLSGQLNRSISDLKKMNARLKKDIEREKQVEEMRKDFIASVSHELRTPISIIKGYAEGLLHNVVQDDSEKNVYCEVIVDESLKMEKHVHELLDLSQIDSEAFSLEAVEFDLGSLVDGVLSKYKTDCGGNGLQITFVKGAPCQVVGDPGRIEQVLVNYLNNAVNYVNENGRIDVSLLDQLDGKTRVEVFNTGSVIPEGSLEKIWTSYYKVDKSRIRNKAGYGLGLSIVRAIQHKHGNDCGVENRSDGVVFWFDISSV